MRVSALQKVIFAVIVLFVMTGCGLFPRVADALPLERLPRISRLPEVPELPEMPPLPELPALPDLPNLPQVDIVPQPESRQQPVNPGDALSLESAYIDVYERINPSVVNIRVVLGAGTTSPLPELPNLPELPELPEGIPGQAQGSGFVYDQQGHIVTNNHVVEGAERIIVTFSDGSESAAELIGNDPDSDLAVIKVEADPGQLIPVSLGESESLRVGQIVVAIGNPFGLQNSLSTGVISGLGRLLPTNTTTTSGRYSIPDMIQTDTAINPGNSGGPLLNLNGEVVGVNTAITSATRSNSGVGYAVPAGIVARVVPQLIENGSAQHPWLGISGGTLNADLARAMELNPNQRGVLVSTVVAGSPAEKAGLRPSTTETTIDGLPALIGGDIITAIEDRPVRVFDDLLGYIFNRANVGDTVTLTILRDGTEQSVEVTLAARPPR